MPEPNLVWNWPEELKISISLSPVSAIVILLGCIVIGNIIGEDGFSSIKIVFDEMFTGAIVIFMIEMGIITAFLFRGKFQAQRGWKFSTYM